MTVSLIALLCLLVALILLGLLAIIDFKTFLLPNIYVFPFGGLGIIFHTVLNFPILSTMEIFLGGLVGYGLLWLIRYGGNKYYQQDSLGLGDVKLLGAAGLWLGMDGVLFAMTLGAFFGLLHGLLVAAHRKVTSQEPFSLTRLMIPAGPGFIGGIICVGGWLFHPFLIRLMHDVIPLSF